MRLGRRDLSPISRSLALPRGPMLGAGRIAPAAPTAARAPQDPQTAPPVDRGTVSGPSRASTRDGQLESSTHQLAGGEGGRFGAYMNCLMSFERSMTNAFGELGFFVATYPREVQVACLVITLLSCLGFLSAHFETAPEKLWVLIGGRSVDDLAYVADIWGGSPRTIILYLQSASGDGQTDVLNSEFLDPAAWLHQEVETLRTEKNSSFVDLCYLMPAEYANANVSVGPSSSPCFVYSVLEFWPLPFSNLSNSLCSDLVGATVAQYAQWLPGFTGCGHEVGARQPDCAATFPVNNALLATMGIYPEQIGVERISTADLCPQACGRCSNSAVPLSLQQQLPGSSTGDGAARAPATGPGGGEGSAAAASAAAVLTRDTRLQTTLQMEEDVLRVDCLDLPPGVILGLSNGLVDGCDSLIDLLGGCEQSPHLPVSLDIIGQNIVLQNQGLLQNFSGYPIPPSWGNNACWAGGGTYTFARCCDTSVSGTGDNSCWDGIYTFQTCCLHGMSDALAQQALTPAKLCPATCASTARGDTAACTDAALSNLGEPTQPPPPPVTPAPHRALPLLTINAALGITKWGSAQMLGHRVLSRTGAVLGARGLRTSYILDCAGRIPGGDESECIELESKIMALISDQIVAKKYSGIGPAGPVQGGDVRVSYYSLQGQYEETVRSVTSAIPLFTLSVILMGGYITASLGKWGEKAKHSKVMVGMIGTFNVILSTVIGFGVSCACGVMLTPMSQIVPFLLLGIGIDDMFVIVRALEMMPEHLTTPQRMKLAMRDCGGSITVTSVTDCVAFCTGATIRFPAMRAFCVHCAVGIVAVFLLTCTFVCASLAIADRAMKGNPSRVGKAIHTCRRIDVHSAANQHDGKPHGGGAAETSNLTRDLLLKYMKPFIEQGTDAQHYSVLAVFLLAAWTGLWGAFQLEEGFKATSMFPEGSYITDSYDTGEQLFRDEYYPFEVVIKGGVKYWEPTVQQEVREMVAQLQALPWIRSDIGNWLDGFVGSRHYPGLPQPGASEAVTEAAFVAGVSSFLGSEEGLQYSQSIKLTADQSQIRASRLDGFFPGDLKDAHDQEQLTEDVRGIVDKSLEGNAFVFSYPILLWEVWTVLLSQLVLNLSETFFAIFVFTNLFLFHPTVSAIICLNVLVVEFELMALCALFSIQLNTVTMCIFVMNFGLVFDYSAHICHKFMTTGGTRRKRTVIALTDMGSGVFNGAFTTFLGFLPLSWAKFGTGVIFAELFTFIILLGIIHGFFALPLMLAQWGPLPVCDNHGATHAAATQGVEFELEAVSSPAYEIGGSSSSSGGRANEDGLSTPISGGTPTPGPGGARTPPRLGTSPANPQLGVGDAGEALSFSPPKVSGLSGFTVTEPV